MHGVVKFDPITGKQFKGKEKSYTQIFAEGLIAEARRDDRVVAIHAAMGGGTGLNIFEKYFKERTYDVGIAEQHAVTFAAGLACEGLVPVCAIYSTFLQRRGAGGVRGGQWWRPRSAALTAPPPLVTRRAYDQVVHDVALQKLPVRFMMDRAGLVGADGATHCGAFDVAFMACIPNMVVMAPSNEAELLNMLATCVALDDAPSCMRYPRGNATGLDLPALGIVDSKGIPMELGRGVVRRQGKDVAVLAYGNSVNEALRAADILEANGVQATVADARFCKPLDTKLIRDLGARDCGGLAALRAPRSAWATHVPRAPPLARSPGAPPPDHRGGGLGGRVRFPRAAVHGPRRPPRRQAAGAPHGHP